MKEGWRDKDESHGNRRISVDFKIFKKKKNYPSQFHSRPNSFTFGDS